MRFLNNTCSALLVGFLLSGCQQPDTTPPLDAEVAYQALLQIFEDWKRGERPESLLEGVPPVRVFEPDWQDGSTLLDYKIDSNGAAFGSSYSLRARVHVKPPTGRKRVIESVYIVTNGEPLSIVRE